MGGAVCGAAGEVPQGAEGAALLYAGAGVHFRPQGGADAGPTQSEATAHVAPAGSGSSGAQVNCAPLSDILARYAGSAQQHADLFILDVEGHEMNILSATDFSKVSVDAVMVEDQLMLPKPDVLDISMARQGFLKFQELALDSVFIRRGHPAAMEVGPMWYPPGFSEEVEKKEQFVRSNLCGFLSSFWGQQQAQGQGNAGQ